MTCEDDSNPWHQLGYRRCGTLYTALAAVLLIIAGSHWQNHQGIPGMGRLEPNSLHSGQLFQSSMNCRAIELQRC